jgi:hypothetical protein
MMPKRSVKSMAFWLGDAIALDCGFGRGMIAPTRRAMKLDGIGALLVRFSAVVFVLRGLVGLANLAWIYSKLHHAVEANVQAKEQFHNLVMNGLWSGLIALACGIVAWLVSKPVGKLIAEGLDETQPATPGA